MLLQQNFCRDNLLLQTLLQQCTTKFFSLGIYCNSFEFFAIFINKLPIFINKKEKKKIENSHFSYFNSYPLILSIILILIAKTSNTLLNASNTLLAK